MPLIGRLVFLPIRFYVLKTHCSAAERNVHTRKQGGKLSDPPDFGRGVLDAPACAGFARASASGGQDAGRLFFWYFSLEPNKEKYIQNYLCCCRTLVRQPEIIFFVPVLCRPKNGYPQERAPLRFASRLQSGCPSRAHDRGNGTNSHNWALRQRAVRIRSHALGSAAKRWG